MLSAIKAILVLPLLFLVAASCSSPSKRTLIEFTLNDGSKIQCVEPPPDVFAKGLKVNADMAAEHIGSLLKGTGGVDVDVERIRQDVTSDVSAFDVIEYRICVQYGNRGLSKAEYHSFTERILPAIRNNTVPSGDTLAKLAIEAVNNPISRLPQTNQDQPPRVGYFSRIRVTNVGQQPVRNVKLIVLKTNGVQSRFQLPVASMDNLFEFSDSPVPNVSTDLKPGEDKEFEAVVECNGIATMKCPKGNLAIFAFDHGKITFLSPVQNGIERLTELTVRATGEGATATLQTFEVVRKYGLIVLKAKSE